MNKNDLHAGNHRPWSGPPGALLSAVALTAFLAVSAAAMGALKPSEPSPDAGAAPDAGGRYLLWAIATHHAATRSPLSTRPGDREVCSPTSPPAREYRTQADSHARSPGG